MPKREWFWKREIMWEQREYELKELKKKKKGYTLVGIVIEYCSMMYFLRKSRWLGGSSFFVIFCYNTLYFGQNYILEHQLGSSYIAKTLAIMEIVTPLIMTMMIRCLKSIKPLL